jgi:hypothetical protein
LALHLPVWVTLASMAELSRIARSIIDRFRIFEDSAHLALKIEDCDRPTSGVFPFAHDLRRFLLAHEWWTNEV